MNFSRILYEREGRTARITLNRPEKRNALDDVMVNELAAGFDRAGADADARVVILSALGSAFCAGADLEYLRRMSSYDLDQNKADSRSLADLLLRMYTLGKPIIALVQGPALAGGCGLATACDFILAARGKATFGYTEVRIGFIPAVVMTFLVKRVGEGKAREMILRGHTFSAEEAFVTGLISAVLPPEDLEQSGNALAAELAGSNSTTAMSLCKEMLSRVPSMPLADALNYAAGMNAAARMTPECKRGIQAFLDKEKLSW